MFIFKGIFRAVKATPYALPATDKVAARTGISNQALCEDTGEENLKLFNKIFRLPVDLVLTLKAGDLVSWLVKPVDFGKGISYVYLGEYKEELKK